MKVLFLTRRFYPDIGGVEKHIEKISKDLIKKGNEVTVLSENLRRYKKSEVYRGIKIYRIPVRSEKNKKWEIWRWLWQNRDLISQADAIHAHDVYYWFIPFKFLYPKKKSYITFHGYETYPIKTSTILMRKLSEKLATGNIIVGDFIKKWYGTKPNYVIYGGVDIPKKENIQPKKNSAIFIGRLDEHTGILEYSKAYSMIRKSFNDFSFTVIGDGKFINRLSKSIKIESSFNASDEITKYEFAFVSGYLSILEAIASKRLVFALYDNPLKEDYIKMSPFNEFIICAKTASELSEKINYFINNPSEKTKYIERAYEWVRDKTWENVAKTYLRLWE
jgi:glycosyltransferase involved in cell wall biosynthesis